MFKHSIERTLFVRLVSLALVLVPCVDARAGSSGATNSGPIVGLYGKCLTALDGAVNLSRVGLSTCVPGNTNQRWTYTANGEFVGAGGRCLNAEGGSSADRTRLILYQCDGSANEKWSLTPSRGISGIGGKCLNVSGGSHVDGTQVILWPCNSASNEKFGFPLTRYDLPVQVIVTQRSGSSVNYSGSNFKTQVDLANQVFERARVRLLFNEATDKFNLTSDLLYSYLNCDTSVESSACAGSNASAVEYANRLAGNYRGKIVLFITPTGNASYSAVSPDQDNFVAFGDTGDWTFIVHEVGHYLGLPHTFGEIPKTEDYTGQTVAHYLSTHGDDVNLFEGDASGPRGPILDTPPDPLERAWKEVGKNACDPAPLVVNGLSFDPDRWNMMTYNATCTGGSHRSVTPDQVGVIQSTLAANDKVHLHNAEIPLTTAGIAFGYTPSGATQMFATGTEGRIATSWKGSTANTPWRVWTALGTLTQPGHITTIRNTNSRSQVFAVSGGQVWTRFNSDDIGNWTPWEAFRTESGHTDVDGATFADGRRMLFSIRDGSVQVQMKLSADAFSGWTAPTSFGVSASQLAVATIPNSAGRLQLLYVAGGRLMTQYQTTTGNTWSSVGDFGIDAVDAALGLTSDGRLAAYAVTPAGQIRMRTKVSSDATSAWSAWTALPGAQDLREFTAVAATNLADGRPQILGIRYKAVWTTYVQSGNSWVGWGSF